MQPGQTVQDFILGNNFFETALYENKWNPGSGYGNEFYYETVKDTGSDKLVGAFRDNLIGPTYAQSVQEKFNFDPRPNILT